MPVPVESLKRKTFTPGWDESLVTTEGLPIKKGGKIVPRYRERVEKEEEKNPKIIDDEDEREVTEQPLKKAKSEAKPKRPALDIDVFPKSEKQFIQLQQKIAEICSQITANPHECVIKKKGKKKEKGDDEDSEDDEEEEEINEEITHHISDLFTMAEGHDVHEIEMSYFSLTLIFKDICPSYRISEQKKPTEADAKQSVQLKKETRKLVEFETNLLKYYSRFIKLLRKRIEWGLGTISNINFDTRDFSNSASLEDESKESYILKSWTVKQKLGYTALKCTCELLKGLTEFNFHSDLLETVITYSCLKNDLIASTCCSTVKTLIKQDKKYEISYEIILNYNKVLKLTKFHLPILIFKILETFNLTIHVDYGKDIKSTLKNEKKKRKKNKDEVSNLLLESNQINNQNVIKKNQANLVQEISLLYFRIIKAKVGFALLPYALSGLSRITHLLNIDLVTDLMTVLKIFLENKENNPSINLNIRTLCVYCALNTLSGPGKELQIDDEPYLAHFRQILREVTKEISNSRPHKFTEWNYLLECFILVFLDRHEERNHIILQSLRLLLFHSVCSSQYFSTNSTLSNNNSCLSTHKILSLVHNIYLRYPKLRNKLTLFQKSSSIYLKNEKEKKSFYVEDDECGDLALEGLLLSELNTNNNSNATAMQFCDREEEQLGDGTWILSMLSCCPDAKVKNLVNLMGSRDVMPVSFKLDMKDLNNQKDYKDIDFIMSNLQESINSLLSLKKSKEEKKNIHNGKNNNKNHQNNKSKNNK